jgi:4-methyl-5(b-hydroxyethyl)-thiazole monophosphate biosynthesis
MRLLRNEEAICYPGFEDDLEDAILSKKDVVVSGKIITGKGLGVAVEFALKLVELFKDKDTANQLAKTIVVPE